MLDELKLRESALEMSEGLAPTASNLVRVASGTDEEAARWAFKQWDLRRRGQTKFERASAMLFDSDGLEMATSEGLARYHATRFPDGEHVVDLTCGIGADLIALARRGPATGFEMDPERAACARHNLSVYRLDALVLEEDCLEHEGWNAEYGFCDPARRHSKGRTLRIDEFQPDPMAIARRFECMELGGIKLSPMLSDGILASLGPGVEFVSFGGECREALVWLGARARAGRRAVLAETGVFLESGENSSAVPKPKAFLFEADPAAIRAHCLGALGETFGLKTLADSNGYLTGDDPVVSPWLKSYEVLAEHSADVKRTHSELRRLGGGTPVVKCRGVQLDVEALRRDLRGVGEELMVIVYAEGRSRRHAICRPLAKTTP